MQIIINDKTYGERFNLEEVINEIKQLPSPKITRFKDVTVDPKKSLICLQHEMLYLNANQNPVNYRYIGTKAMYDCILLYLYTKTDHAILHVDVNDQNELLPAILSILSKFENQDEIYVSIAGGHQYHKNNSDKNLANIIGSLAKAAYKIETESLTKKIKVLFQSQYIIEHNHQKKESLEELCYNGLIKQITLLYEQVIKNDCVFSVTHCKP